MSDFADSVSLLQYKLGLTVPSYLPAEASIVQIRAFFRASNLSFSATIDLYDSSLYLWAASMNFLL